MQEPRYYPTQPVSMTERMAKQIRGAVREVDPAQAAVFTRKSNVQRVSQAASMTEDAEHVGVFRMRAREPQLSKAQALRIVRRGLIEYYQTRQPRGVR